MPDDAAAPAGLCSALSRGVGEPRAGTAPQARLWILLEQPGPWGRDAVADSHLPAPARALLQALGAHDAVRVGLIRAPGEHADPRPSGRTLLVARTDPEAPWLTSRRLDDPTGVGSIDPDRCLRSTAPPPDLPGAANPTLRSAVVVCTNARRDRCCALLGRPLVAQLAAQHDLPASTVVWETSHLGGHRFAPTFASLPDGYLFGGPDAQSRSIAACRGRSSLPPAAQAAELAVLAELGAVVPRPLDVRATGEADTWTVLAEGTALTVHVARQQGPDRPESCGKGSVASHWFAPTITHTEPAAMTAG